MSENEVAIAEYREVLRARVSDRALELGEGEEVAPTGFREVAFTSVVLETLEDLGQLGGGEVCFFERKVGQAIARVNAWYADEEDSRVDLVATIFRGIGKPQGVTRSDIVQFARRAIAVYSAASKAFHEKVEQASAAFDMLQRLHELGPAIRCLRIIVVVDGLAEIDDGLERKLRTLRSPGDVELKVEVWDLRRLYRAHSSGLTYEPVEIDLVKYLGRPLECLVVPEGATDYRSYLAIFPGVLLHALYDEFGARLLELNVRSFLQARGKVNRGIRDTLKSTPTRFMAYNNGISITAEHVDLTNGVDGGTAIRSITGLQIVNGGQTVASIHRAGGRERIDLSSVHVQAKITVVDPEHLESLVPLISRYANTQNRVNEADFSANHPYHVKIQQLSNRLWTPGEQSRWFYERARGQYEVARSRETTTARTRRFEKATPKKQRFDKVQLARFMNAWDGLPHVVCRGGQKNFVAFMERLPRLHGADWEPDAEYFRRLVARAIIFGRAEYIARKHAFSGYRANAVAYTVALFSYRTAGRIDLDAVWNQQANQQRCPEAIHDTMYDWMPTIHQEIITSAGTRNVGEWSKKEECWRHIQTLDLQVPRPLEDELARGQPLPTVGKKKGQGGALSTEDRENIARVMQITGDEWIHISGWGARTGCLEEWQSGIAGTLATYAAAGWRNVPSAKQARHGVKILAIADQEVGGRRLQEE